MKKRMLIPLSLALVSFGCFGLSVANEQKVVCYAEEEPIGSGAVDEETDTFDKLSQWAIDSCEVIKTVFNQPIVVGGVSTTLGLLVIAILTKLIGVAKTKSSKQLLNEIKDMGERIKGYVSAKDYNALAKECETLKGVCEKILPTIKNVEIKKEVAEMLNEIKPIVVDESVEFGKQVVEETKAQVVKETSEVLEILNKD